MDRAGKAELEDQARAIDLQADPMAASRPLLARVDRVGKLVPEIGRRAVPMVAVPLPVVRVNQVDRAENAGRAFREAQVVRVEMVAVDLDLQPSL